MAATASNPKDLFRAMLRIRRLEERIVALYPEQEMRCPVHLSIGQEAPAVGACAALEPDDYAMSAHRSHAHYLAKGGDMKAMLAELYGKVTGCCMGKGGSMHFIDLPSGFLGATPIVGSTIAIAVGAAFGSFLKKDGRVTAAFFGDGSTEEGAFHEAVNFASLKKLPIVFVCENNFFSVYSPLTVRQPQGRELVDLAKAHGVESFQGDGNDVLEVERLCRAAADKARAGGGPTFLEFKTYRWYEHCGVGFDNDIGYRSETEFLEWKRRCPIDFLQRRLIGDGLMNESEVAAMEAEIKTEVDAAVRFAKESPFPGKELLMQHIYAETPAAKPARKPVGARR
jgi:pyruvate dehydrogenase E1 component alpha subunit